MTDTAACVECGPNGEQGAISLPCSVPATPQATQDPLDPATFVPPSASITPSITIEFCDRCRWLHRATWVSTELFLTFPTPIIRAITVMPLNSEETGGRFRVWLYLDGKPPILAWDRKVEGGFPELKVLMRFEPIRNYDFLRPGKRS